MHILRVTAVATMAFVVAAAHAQSTILLEACNAMENPNKRLECLKAVVASLQGSSISHVEPAPPARASSPSSRYASTPALSLGSLPYTARSAPETATPRPSNPAGQTCFTGPRGGTYTITASGRKNYGGC